MIFHTRNSTYEVSGTAVRRLTGTNDPTPRQGPDGQWKEFIGMSPEIKVGQPVCFSWRTAEKNGQQVLESTFTSAVTAIEE